MTPEEQNQPKKIEGQRTEFIRREIREQNDRRISNREEKIKASVPPPVRAKDDAKPPGNG